MTVVPNVFEPENDINLDSGIIRRIFLILKLQTFLIIKNLSEI